jgi:hypothetical protein
MIIYSLFVFSGIILIPLFHVILFYVYSNTGQINSMWSLYRQTQCALDLKQSRLTKAYKWYVIIWLFSFVLWFVIIILAKINIIDS